jgi:APA family basic amino acid/polyamine antiporter
VVAVAGFSWLALGVTVYVFYRRHQGLDLTTTVKVAIPEAVTDHEAEYASVLVHMSFDEGYNTTLIATAVKLAARRRRGIHVLVTIPVPNALPVDEPLPAEDARAASLLEQARVQGGRRLRGHVERVRPGQAGRRIIEEAAGCTRAPSSWGCRGGSTARRCSARRWRPCCASDPAA